MKNKLLDKKNTIKLLVAAVPIIVLGLIFGKDTIVFLFVLAAILLDFAIFAFPALKYFGIELVTFATVLIGFAYGPAAGAVAGLVLLVFHLAIARYSLGTYIVWLIPEYVLVGFLSGLLQAIGFMNLGFYAAIGINLTNIFLSLFFDMENFSGNIVYSITNCAFNIFLFMQLSWLVTGIFI